MITEVWQQLRRMAQLQEQDAPEWADLCAGCLARLRARLRPEVDPDDVAPCLCRAAAGLAFYEAMLVLAARGDTGSFAAGDLKMTRRGADVLQAAREIRDRRLGEMAPYLRDNAFAFCGVSDHA